MTRSGASFRLLVLLDQLQPTGLVRQLLELLERLVARGVAVRVACVAREGSDAGPLTDALGRLGVPCDVLRERYRFDPRPLADARRVIDDFRPDILETHGYKSAAYALLLRRSSGPRWVAFYHGRTTTSWMVRAYHRFERWAMSRADVIATVSTGVAGHLRATDRERLMVVPNGVVPLAPIARSPQETRAELGFGANEAVLGFVGRLSFEKGPDRFIEVVEQMHARRPTVRGLVVGDGPMREELEARAGDPGGRLVRFVGHVDRVADVYGAMDALVISSRSEVFPNVLLEAVDSGVPVAATPVGGIPWIAEGLDSVVVAPDSARLPLAVERALAVSDRELRTSRRRLHARFSQAKRVERALEVYHAALEDSETAQAMAATSSR